MIINLIKLKKISTEYINCLCFKTPTITKDSDYLKLKEIIESLLNIGINKILISNIGTLYYIKKLPIYNMLSISIDCSINVMNSYSFIYYTNYLENIHSIAMSNEFDIKYINDFESNLFLNRNIIIKNKIPKIELFVYGCPKIMISEYSLYIPNKDNIINSNYHIDNFNFYSFQLVNLNGLKFPVLYDISKQKRTHIFNFKNIDLINEMMKRNVLNKNNFILRIDSISLNSEDLNSILQNIRNINNSNKL